MSTSPYGPYGPYESSNENQNQSQSQAHQHELPQQHDPIILYKPPTIYTFLRSASINLVLPFVNGLMLGFGELFAHEIAFRWGWGGTRIFPQHRLTTRRVAPGVEVKDKQTERTYAGGLDDLASLE